MNKKDASAEDTAVGVAEAVTEANDADTATDEAATIKETDTENKTKANNLFCTYKQVHAYSLDTTPNS